MTLMDTQQEQPVCGICHQTIPAGEEVRGIGDLEICADFDACVERMRRPNAPAREAAGEGNEDAETGGTP